jgi:ABC-type cobalamin/Fe3+-siderophores transport system ATPase subunit
MGVRSSAKDLTMASYQGMRWFKCDLQVQTPEGSDWLDPELKLGEPRRPLVGGAPDETDLQAKARAFLRRCHELELDVIGVTDHNFSSKSDVRDLFLTHLIDQNKSVATEMGRSALYILPGFEVDISYHALCLFEPTTKSSKLGAISQILSALGLPIESRFRGGKPQPLRSDNRYVSLAALLHRVQAESAGIVIAAHAFSDDGICNDPCHIDDYKNEELLCVEVSDPLSQKANSILSGLDQQWSRQRRHPAAIMSSDAKSLKASADGSIPPNALGYRSTWIKMSSPSIESLRQAFLDSSRLVVSPPNTPTPRPDLAQTYPRLVSLSLSNLAFLEDQDLSVSPNLNCIIGGRGSGKSTLLECIRIATKKTRIGADVKRKVDRVRKTFGSKTQIRIEWQAAPGVIDNLVFTPGETESQDLWRWDGKNTDEIDAFLQHLPIQIFSQGELTEIASSSGTKGNGLLPLIDAAHAAELHQLESAMNVLRADVMKLYAAGDQKRQISSDLEKLKLELQELDRQWQARQDIKGEAEAHRTAQVTDRYLSDLHEDMRRAANALEAAIEELADDGVELVDLPASVLDGPDGPWLASLQQDHSAWRLTLTEGLRKVITDARVSAEKLTTRRPGWEEMKARNEAAQAQFFEACRARGLQPQDVSRLQEIDRQRQAKLREVEAAQRRLATVTTEIKRLEDKPGELSGKWFEQFLLRKTSIDKLNTSTKPSVTVSVQYMADKAHFSTLWARLAPDGRTKLGRSWLELGEELFISHLASQNETAIWDALRDWILRDLELAGMDRFEEFRTELREYLVNQAREIWRDVRNTRVADFIDITLFGQGGKKIGSMTGGELSEGQRNTAVLTVLLAQGSGPMVIDQPEDEVDSNFLYENLVPILRKVKNHRQLIFVTHNANIPVNADAELVLALEATDGHGRLRTEGGLDSSQVTDAILDIMEGTDEAFLRRSEKYNF